MQNYSILFGPFWFPIPIGWWRWWDSNPWPPACRAGALPAELHPHIVAFGSDIASQWYYFVVILLCSDMPLAWVFAFFSKRSFKIEQRIKLLRQNRHFMSHTHCNVWTILHRKEVIQPHLPIRLPCYDLTPIIEPTFDCCLLAVSSQASGVPNFHGLTGGVYKARERIHRGMLIRDY